MTATEVQALASQSSCFLCQVPVGLVGYVVLVELDLISKGQAVPTDPQELLSAANCLACLVPVGLVPYLILVKLQELT